MSTNHRGGNIQNEITLEEHDGANNAKRVNVVAGDITVNSSSTVFIGTPTLHAVVNTSAAGDSVANIGFATVAVSTPTLYAVVNTSAAGVGQSIVTVINPITLNSVVTLSPSVNSIGFATVHQGGTWTVTQASAARTITGNITLDPGSRTGIVGNITLTDSKAYVGLVTATLGTGTAAIGKLAANSGVDIGDVDITSIAAGDNNIGNVDLASAIPTGENFIGIVTVANPSSFAGNITLDPGSLTGISGNVTITDSKAYIGLVTATSVQGGTWTVQPGNTANTTPWLVSLRGNVTLSDAKTYIGLTTTTLGTGLSNIGFATVAVSTPTLFAVVNTSAAGTTDVTSDSGVTVYQGDASWTVDNAGLTELAAAIDTEVQVDVVGALPAGDNNIGNIDVASIAAGANYIGLASVNVANIARTITGNVTLSDAKTFIGLVTAWSRNAGTTKTLIHKNIAFAQASVVTIAVPTNTFKITHLLVNSNATVRVNIKSGASYLTGNVTLGINLNPGGGWVENGSPDSPIYVGLAGAAAIVVEKADSSGNLAQIGGKLIYFDE